MSTAAGGSFRHYNRLSSSSSVESLVIYVHIRYGQCVRQGSSYNPRPASFNPFVSCTDYGDCQVTIPTPDTHKLLTFIILICINAFQNSVQILLKPAFQQEIYSFPFLL